MVSLPDGGELRIVSYRETDGTWLHYVPSGSVAGVAWTVTLWLAEMVDMRGGTRITAAGDCACPAGRHGRLCRHLCIAAQAERILAPELWDIARLLSWERSTTDYSEGVRRLAAIRWQPDYAEVA